MAVGGRVPRSSRRINDLRKIRVVGVADPVGPVVAAWRGAVRRIEGLLAGASEADAARLRRIGSEIADAVEAADAAAARWARATIEPAYELGAGVAQAEVERVLARAGVGFASASFTGVDARAARALVERTAASLGNLRQALFDGLALSEPKSRRTIDAIRAALAGDNALVRLEGGALRVLTPSVRLWRPEPYARMVARTSMSDALRVSNRNRYLGNGVDVVRVVSTGSTHDVCAAWENETLSLTGATPDLPTVDEAVAAGLFHPNCAHRYVVDLDFYEANPEALGPIDRVPPPTPAFTTLGRAPARPRVDVEALRARQAGSPRVQP